MREVLRDVIVIAEGDHLNFGFLSKMVPGYNPYM